MSFFQLFQYCLGSGLGTIGDFSIEQLLHSQHHTLKLCCTVALATLKGGGGGERVEQNNGNVLLFSSVTDLLESSRGVMVIVAGETPETAL